jgi:tetratricopeptide (TPR) repeat protein
VVGEAFYSYYQRVLTSEADLEACVAKYGIEWIVFPYATNPKLLARLSKDPRWRLAYVDAVAAIFVREGPRASALIDPALSVPGPAFSPAPDALPGLGGAPRRGALARWIDGLLHRQRFPWENFYRGLFHYYRGEMDPAQARFAAGIMEAGGSYYELYNNLGSVLYQKRRLKEAGDCYRVVLRDDPGNRLAAERLAAISRTGGTH